ncbi:30S ribosomal protein S3 [Candidatus Peregrinibacteria bacterium CG11_big_fil_rev_8_21_14_0_20_41_10]|nr:MAG: 30S ribosomal protein S3 [Candidatus Peregrinibacteria bacterium CG11_big_fil_rev_8_21_14_0_20_41_10]PIZ76764.1 MAG: 30S ribosomal protein S3 [Candidatus Peregrinibacteria bacterium CG_4_10_14_0_2_um_filter_41_8]PJC37967.1 MAG: 30S ribosomal protein S3 [Candidatus Peregrinibacteria bacterium CG_4_9_14_0_2_um_filter_41_14]
MGQKVHPVGMRIGINRGWNSSWFGTKRNYASLLHQELRIREYLDTQFNGLGVSYVELAQNNNIVDLKIHTAKPGLIIGQQGAKIEELKEKLHSKFNLNFSIEVIEIRKPAIDAAIVADSIAKQLERRISYRRACKAAIEKAMEQGAKGIKISLGGRLNGVEIARSEFFTRGKIPLHTLRADIDYKNVRAQTTYGAIGIKVWVYHGEVFDRSAKKETSK